MLTHKKQFMTIILAILMAFSSGLALADAELLKNADFTEEVSRSGFIVGLPKTETVTVVLEPNSIPMDSLIWAIQKEGIAEIADKGDGTATVTPLTAGKATITVKECGGKTAQVKVSVLEPVTNLELSAKSQKVKPGETVAIQAILEPKKPAIQDLEWTIDVREDIATIDAKGKVKISKTAPVGTVITVTCKALGAPEPIVKTIQIEVE